MKTNKLGQASAFPYPSEKCKTDDQGRPLDFGYRKSLGMNKRLYLAGMAMQGMLASDRNAAVWIPEESLARKAFMYADELLRQEAK